MSKPRRYTITLQGMPPSGNQRKRMHHMQLYRIDGEWATCVHYALLGVTAGCMSPFARARVRVTLVHNSARYLMDMDGATASLKGTIDGLKGLAVVDDDPAHMELVVEQRVEWGKPRRVVIEVEELEDEGK